VTISYTDPGKAACRLGTDHWNTICGNVQALVEGIPSIVLLLGQTVCRRSVGGWCQVIVRRLGARKLQSADYG
jgi:hypothetical protein